MSNPAVISQHLDIVESYEKVGFLDSYMERVGDKVLVGYLSPDHEPINPLKDCDGMGHIYSAHRHSSDHDEMREALGLDAQWSPDLELVDEHPDRFRKAWISAAANSVEFEEWCQEFGRVPDTNDPVRLEAYFKRKAARFWRDTGGVETNYYHNDSIEDFIFTDDVREEVWKELSALRLVGDPDRVSLDVYEHSGVAYSVSGEGMSCMWDTAHGGALWVPDDCAREELNRRAEVYQYGQVVEKRFRGKTKFTFQVDGRKEVTSFRFDYWHEAFDALAKAVASKGKGDQLLGRIRSAKELARNAAEAYTDYCNGASYDVIIETFEVTDEEIGSTRSVDDEVLSGHLGSEYAESSLKSEFDAELDRLKSE